MKHISKIQSGTNLFPLNTVQANNKQPKTNVLNSVDVIHIFSQLQMQLRWQKSSTTQV